MANDITLQYQFCVHPGLTSVLTNLELGELCLLLLLHTDICMVAHAHIIDYTIYYAELVCIAIIYIVGLLYTPVGMFECLQKSSKQISCLPTPCMTAPPSSFVKGFSLHLYRLSVSTNFFVAYHHTAMSKGVKVPAVRLLRAQNSLLNVEKSTGFLAVCLGVRILGRT